MIVSYYRGSELLIGMISCNRVPAFPVLILKLKPQDGSGSFFLKNKDYLLYADDKLCQRISNLNLVW
jgi:hypothetical protein